MLADSLKQEIEKFAEGVTKENPFFLSTTQGVFREEQLKCYLDNILYLVRHTPKHLRLAQQVTGLRGEKSLENYFRTKQAEEVGHDLWAEEDMHNLGAKPHSEGQNYKILESMKKLVSFLEETISADPTLYLPYILLSEYFTVLVAPAWLDDLESKCGITRRNVSVISKHAELDKEHVKHDIHELNNLMNNFTRESEMVQVLRQAMAHYAHFLTEIGTLTQAS